MLIYRKVDEFNNYRFTILILSVIIREFVQILRKWLNRLDKLRIFIKTHVFMHDDKEMEFKLIRFFLVSSMLVYFSWIKKFINKYICFFFTRCFQNIYTKYVTIDVSRPAEVKLASVLFIHSKRNIIDSLDLFPTPINTLQLAYLFIIWRNVFKSYLQYYVETQIIIRLSLFK